MTFPRIQVHTITLTHAHMYTPTCTHPHTRTHAHTYLRPHTRAHAANSFSSLSDVIEDLCLLCRNTTHQIYHQKQEKTIFCDSKLEFFCQPSGEGRSSLSSHPVKLLGLNKKFFLTNLKNAIFVESVAFYRFMAAFEPISCRKWKWDSSGTLMNFVSIATANQSCRRFVWCQCVDKVYQLTARWCLSSIN